MVSFLSTAEDSKALSRSTPLNSSPRKSLVWAFLRHRFGILAVFLAAGLLSYYPALSGAFIWDDEYLVGQNPF